MFRQLCQKHNRLYKAVDKILWSDWDPIGIKILGGPRDEYQSYVPHLFAMAINGTTQQEIAEYLHWIAANQMGFLESTVEKQLAVAKTLFDTITAVSVRCP